MTGEASVTNVTSSNNIDGQRVGGDQEVGITTTSFSLPTPLQQQTTTAVSNSTATTTSVSASPHPITSANS